MAHKRPARKILRPALPYLIHAMDGNVLPLFRASEHEAELRALVGLLSMDPVEVVRRVARSDPWIEELVDDVRRGHASAQFAYDRIIARGVEGVPGILHEMIRGLERGHVSDELNDQEVVRENDGHYPRLPLVLFDLLVLACDRLLPPKWGAELGPPDLTRWGFGGSTSTYRRPEQSLAMRFWGTPSRTVAAPSARRTCSWNESSRCWKDRPFLV